MMIRALLALLILLTLFPGPGSLCAEPEREERIAMIREVQALRADKGSVGFDESTGKLVQWLEEGDAGLAFQVAKSGGHMLDNEAYFTVLACAILYHLDAVETAFMQMPAATRNSILEVGASGGEMAFEDAELGAKFEKQVALLKAFSAKLPDKLSNPEKVRPAYIDDPDGYTNLRLLPDTKSPILDEIKTGEEFQVITEKGDWCYVKSPRGDIAWVHKSRVHYKYAQ